jgi:hypothetical protein
LSYETWDTVFEGDDVNKISNSFLNTHLRIFYSSSPLTQLKKKERRQLQRFPGLPLELELHVNIRDPYIASKNNKDPSF